MTLPIHITPGATEVVVFTWSRKHGDCEDCGRPAAFHAVEAGGYRQPLCAVCAANAACRGAAITRIETDCVHCGRVIINFDGEWIDPEATGDDAVWRTSCDGHTDDFVAAHEPVTG